MKHTIVGGDPAATGAGAPPPPAVDPALAGFAAQAQAFDGAGTAGAGQGAPPPEAGPSGLEQSTQAASFLLVVVREAVAFAFNVEAPRRELSDKRLQQCAAEIGKADDATGGKLRALLDGGGAWMQCAVAVGPILWQVAAATLAEIKAKAPVDAQAREVKPAVDVGAGTGTA